MDLLCRRNNNSTKGVSLTSSLPLADAEYVDRIDDRTADIYIIVQYCVISSLLNIFGIVTNIISAIVFVKQGFKESINISLLGLSISDGCSLVALQWMNVCFSPIFRFSGIPVVSLDLAYLTAVWPRIAFTRITAWITAFITFERCICIALPLKVKTLITPNRTAGIVLVIFITIIASILPTYYTGRLEWKFNAETNRTLLRTIFREDRHSVEVVVFTVCGVGLPMMAFFIIVICTATLVVKLNNKSKWRRTASLKADQLCTKERKVVKMVSLISTIFIVCFFPIAVGFSVNILIPDMNLDGKLRNTGIIVGSMIFFMESINSSINIFIYMKTSSKFRDTFYSCFMSKPIQKSY